jgi:hypothetical protein
MIYICRSLERVIKASGSAVDRKAAMTMVNSLEREVALFGGQLIPPLTTEFRWIDAATLPCSVRSIEYY